MAVPAGFRTQKSLGSEVKALSAPYSKVIWGRREPFRPVFGGHVGLRTWSGGWQRAAAADGHGKAGRAVGGRAKALPEACALCAQEGAI